MVDEVVGQTDRVADEIEDLAAANPEQAAMVTEVESSAAQLSSTEAKTDGGASVGSDGVSIPGDLPDNIPDFVTEMLSEEQLSKVARGEVKPEDVL